MRDKRQEESSPKKKMCLDIPAAAEYAGFSERPFRKFIENGQITVMKIGRKQFVQMEVLEK